MPLTLFGKLAEKPEDLQTTLLKIHCSDLSVITTNKIFTIFFLGYDKLEYSPLYLFQNTSKRQRRIFSNRRNIAPHPELKACRSYSLQHDTVEIFHPEFLRKMQYVYDGKQKTMGVSHHRLILSQCMCII